jgi:hypothetical protein
MSAHAPSVSAVIRLVSALRQAAPALRIDVVGPDLPPVLLLQPSAGLGLVLRRPALSDKVLWM